MIEDIKKDAADRMAKSVDALTHELAKIRTGRAHPSLLDHITVSYYGSEMPIRQVANVNAEDARTLTVTPWEKNMVQAIEKAIMQSDLGLNPNTAGTVIRVPMPPLTEERRKDLVKVAKKMAEEGRVSVRNIRRHANDEIKKTEKSHEITEDDKEKAQHRVQELTDKFIKEIDVLLDRKEKEVMEV